MSPEMTVRRIKPLKLTQAQIEERLQRRAAEIKKKVEELEKSSIVTQATMNLEFHDPSQCVENH